MQGRLLLPDIAEVLVDGLDHPEGVAWDPTSGTVVAGGEDGQIYRIDLAARAVSEIARAPGFVLGLAVDGLGRIAICSSGARALYAFDGASMRRLCDTVEGQPLVNPNYPAFAADGTLYVSDSGAWSHNDGRVLRIDADGTATTLSRALNRFPNGCAVSPDGRHLWLVESFSPTLNRFDLAAPGRPDIVQRLDGTVPDGLAFTSDGGLLISCYRPDRIYHLDTDGRLEIVAEDPQGTLLAAPTNVCFVGPALDRLVTANLGRWHLTLLTLGLSGAPLHRPERWALDTITPADG